MTKLLTTAECASLLNVPNHTVRKLCDAGRLTCTGTAASNRMIDPESLIAWLAANNLPVPPQLVAAVNGSTTEDTENTERN